MARHLGAEVLALTVIEPYAYASLAEYRPETIAEYEQRSEALAGERLATVLALAKEGAIACQGRTVRGFSPFEAIIDTARHEGCDVIFMASHGRRGLGAVLLGSETQKVLTHSQIPVMVYR
jgi:nucleotide-binding universal stress UspA family protein